MKKIKISSLILQDNLKSHKEIKSKLLSLIEKSVFSKEERIDDYYDDTIYRLDWLKNNDFNREWVKFSMPYLQEKFNHFAKKLNFQFVDIKSIWYQQYIKNNYHGWHIHGENYTGVYYLEFPKGSPKTELIDQYNINKKITINAKEGDVIIFPSFIIHRAPIVKKDVKKTIISFNLEFKLINPAIFSTINSL